MGEKRITRRHFLYLASGAGLFELIPKILKENYPHEVALAYAKAIAVQKYAEKTDNKLLAAFMKRYLSKEGGRMEISQLIEQSFVKQLRISVDDQGKPGSYLPQLFSSEIQQSLYLAAGTYDLQIDEGQRTKDKIESKGLYPLWSLQQALLNVYLSKGVEKVENARFLAINHYNNEDIRWSLHRSTIIIPDARVEFNGPGIVDPETSSSFRIHYSEIGMFDRFDWSSGDDMKFNDDVLRAVTEYFEFGREEDEDAEWWQDLILEAIEKLKPGLQGREFAMLADWGLAKPFTISAMWRFDPQVIQISVEKKVLDFWAYREGLLTKDD